MNWRQLKFEFVIAPFNWGLDWGWPSSFHRGYLDYQAIWLVLGPFSFTISWGGG